MVTNRDTFASPVSKGMDSKKDGLFANQFDVLPLKMTAPIIPSGKSLKLDEIVFSSQQCAFLISSMTFGGQVGGVED